MKYPGSPRCWETGVDERDLYLWLERLDHIFGDVGGLLEDVIRTDILPDRHQLVSHSTSC